MSAIFPNVPLTAGVPAVLRNAANSVTATQTALRASAYDNSSSNDWGVFDRAGNRVLTPDNIVSVEFGGEYRIADYPTEAGGFQSYNKVAMPFEVRLTMAKGGSVTDRTAFLNALETLRSSLTTVDIATPERVYVNVNLTHLGQARSASSGAGMAVVETVFQEVRETVAITYAVNDPVIPPPPATPTAAPAPTARPAPVTPRRPNAATVRRPAAAPAVNRGSVQAAIVGSYRGNIARLVTSPSGRKLIIYDRPIGM